MFTQNNQSYIDKPSLPDFLVIGAPKSGTTSLFYYLKQHPDIYLPVQKELHYFSYNQLKCNVNGPGDSHVINGLCGSWQEYINYYSNCRNQKSIGEVSPSYLYHGVQERIKDKLGVVKIVVILRNPVEKAYSQYMHMVRDQREILPFYDALLAEDDRQKNGWSDIWRYAESSLYSNRLIGYINCFGKENIHVILFDDFVLQTELVMRDLFGFLEIDDGFPVNIRGVYNRTGKVRSKSIAKVLNQPNKIKNMIKQMTPDAWRIALRLKIMGINTANKPVIDVKSEKYLREYFAADISKLNSILGHRLSW